MSKNGRLPDYRVYSFQGMEWLPVVLKMGAAVGICSLFFYKSIWAVLFLSPLAYVLYKKQKLDKCKERKRKLNRQFMECIMSVSVSLQAGYSVENAFLESRTDMENYYGRDSLIYSELEGIRRGLLMHIPLEQQLLNLGQRSEIEDIVQFANIFSIAKKRGGDMTHLIGNTVDQIRERVETGEEIHVLLAGKKMEQNIMRFMPFGILLYIGITYPGYFNPFYGEAAGILLMTAALLIYLSAYALGEVILNKIEEEMTNASHKWKPQQIRTFEGGLLGKLADQIKKREKLLKGTFSLRQNLEFLYPQKERKQVFTEYVVSKWIMAICIFVGTSFLITIYAFKNGTGSDRILWIGIGIPCSLLFAIVLFVLMDRDLEKQADKQRELLRMEYPDIVHKLALYMGAGLSPRACFMTLQKEYDSILYACRDFQAGMLETVVYERFGRRLGVKEYIRLGMLLSQNCRRGNAGLLDRLEEEALHVTREKQQEVKALGEKAQTKLLLPMVLLLFVVMMLIMLPAFMEM